MGRSRRTSKVLEKAMVRLAGIKAINPTLDLGGGLTAVFFDTSVTDVQSKLEAYNQALAVVDEKYNTLIASEQNLNEASERIRAGVAARFGKNSSEYEQAGGVRKSERRPPGRKPKAAPGAV
jgi:hypothetical protein